MSSRSATPTTQKGARSSSHLQRRQLSSQPGLQLIKAEPRASAGAPAPHHLQQRRHLPVLPLPPQCADVSQRLGVCPRRAS